ncbi:MAG: diacylglycerol kinase [Paracoccaceae bacterium]
MRRLAGFALLLAVAAAVSGWLASAPSRIDPARLAGLTGDAERGRRIFLIGGCASCHSAPKAEGEEFLKLSGGRRFASPFGTFIAPNISPDPVHGIGNWSDLDLVNAMLRGVSPDGGHYYPAFPYTSFIRAEIRDVVDLRAYLATLPPVAKPNLPHEVGFPFNIRRGVGLWKMLHLTDVPRIGVPDDAEIRRGQYLVEALGHCGECHTARNYLGATRADRWLAGAPSPDGPGRVPNITPHETGIGDWSAADIAEYLLSGFRPDFDTAGGAMVDVIANTSLLPPEDREAIAAYLKSAPPLPAKR